MKHTDQSQFIAFDSPALPVTPVLGLPLVNAKTHEVAQAILAPGRKTVAFFNAHCANERARTPAYARALRRAEFVLPDGIGIELAARLDGRALAENLNGTDFVPALLARAAKAGRSVFLLGGRPGTAQAAAQRLCMDIPGLRVVGMRDGYGGIKRRQDTIDEINESGADIVLVALGVPLQELWIDANRHAIDADVVLGVGALFDFLAGNVRRAPGLVRRARMEWAWRLAMEPRRMAKRYLVGNATFLARAALFAWQSPERAARRAEAMSAQRVLDIAISGAALLGLALPMGAIAMAIRLDSKGPALFAQTRTGKDGRTFKVLKFRSMVTDAEARRAALLATSDREGLCFKSRTDPRVTRIGKVLRRLSLDELPQLINVLKGDMSIVGPRPALPEEVAQYPARALQRLKVKPGITGLWQVSGRATIGFDKMVDLDLAYVRNRSVWLDMLLIALTFRAVLSGRGAY
ncbi:WecB/TagA/CpsF family glycosyltransferase [Primorskyibacter sp. S187A]|uniref:WecB/TagA/CpsF family glycosyltransferase n=1 Tax=Primorskyibacter sp. S187A TaxID=3415130 RepID=UPI003C7C2D95